MGQVLEKGYRKGVRWRFPGYIARISDIVTAPSSSEDGGPKITTPSRSVIRMGGGARAKNDKHLGGAKGGGEIVRVQ